MEVLVTTNPGLEDTTSKEIEELLGVKCEERPLGILGRVKFSVKNIEDAIYYTYVSKTANRVVVLLDSFEVEKSKKGLETLYTKLKSLDFWFLNRDTTFAIRSERLGRHEYTSLDIMRVAGQAVIDSIRDSRGYRQEVDLENPDVIIRVDVVGNLAFVGLDLVGKKGLHLRGYKVYNHPTSLRTTLAHQIIIYSQWSEDKVLLDPLCGSGTIPIEAGIKVKNIPGSFWRKRDLQFIKLDIGVDWFEWMEEIDEKLIKKKVYPKGIIGADKITKNVRGSEINSEKAMVRDIIRWSRYDLEWIDLKLDQGSIDYIITNPPYGKKLKDEVEKVYKYLFFQADWLLTDEGKVVVITNREDFCEKYSKRYKFEKEKERVVYRGDLKTKILVYSKA